MFGHWALATATNRTVTPVTARATEAPGRAPQASSAFAPPAAAALTVAAPTAQGRAAGAMPVAGDTAPRSVRGRGVAVRGNELAVNFGTLSRSF